MIVSRISYLPVIIDLNFQWLEKLMSDHMNRFLGHIQPEVDGAYQFRTIVDK